MKKTYDRIAITLALLACIGFSAFVIRLQQKQEADRQELEWQVQEQQEADRQEKETDQPLVRTRVEQTGEEDGRPVFSLPGGFYPEEITVEITAPEGSRIYYTVDGSLPDAEHGIPYEAPVTVTNVCGSPNVYSAVATVSAYRNYAPLTTVDKAFVLQAVCVNDRGETSGVTCASYFVAMEAKGMYRDLPVLSINTDPEKLFDYFDGMYVTGVEYESALAMDDVRFDSANYYRGKESTAHIEYFESDRYLTYEGHVMLSLRKDGNLDFGQKSFWLKQSDPMPQSDCELYDFCKDGTLLLYGGGTDYAAKSRQQLEERLLLASGASFSLGETKGCMVFVDGEFWGLYLLRRENTVQTFAKMCGVTAEEIQMIQNGYPSQAAPEFRELYQLVTGQDMSVTANYQKLQELMDVESYLDYYCANLYFGNPQFDSFSTTLWRTAGENNSYGKWHWEFPDATDTLGLKALSNYSVNTYLCPGVREDLFFRGLLQNPEFRTAWEQRIAEFAEQMTQEKAEEELNAIRDRHRAAVAETAKRYGLQLTEEGYLADGDSILEYFAGRKDYILRYTEEFLKLAEDSEVPETAETVRTPETPGEPVTEAETGFVTGM